MSLPKPRSRVAGIVAGAAALLVLGIGLSKVDPGPIGGHGTPTPVIEPSYGTRAVASRPPLFYPPLTETGSRATVVVDRLNVLDFPAVVDFPASAAFPIELGKGTEVLVTAGPLASAGLDWYEVYFSWLPTDLPYTDVTYGWIAAGPTGERPTSIKIEAPICPDALTVKILGSMSGLARLDCVGSGPHELMGVLEHCKFSSLGRPEWQFSECLDLADVDGGRSNLSIFFPPTVETAALHLGDFVRVVGHVDDPAASKCRMAQPSTKPVAEALLVFNCRSAFVVSEIEVTNQGLAPSR